ELTFAVGAVLAPNTRVSVAENGGFEPRLWALCWHPTRARVWRRMGDSNPGCGRCACTQHAGVCGGEWGIRTPAVGAVLAPNTRECGAENGGFEPPRACTQHAFQACAIGH